MSDTMDELKNRLKEMNLMEVHVNGRLKKYVTQNQVMTDGDWDNATDVFGIFYQHNKYCIFITDSERGIFEYLDKYDDEREACGELIELMTLHESIYQDQK